MCLYLFCSQNKKPASLIKKPIIFNEIKKHLWIQSEKAGHDIGFDNAANDWFANCYPKWCHENLRTMQSIGLLILRIGIGFMFILHGWPKIFGGPEAWEKIGMATQNVGINFAPTVFGFLCGATELFGGILIIFGLATRVVSLFLFINMAVAVAAHLNNGDGFAAVSHPLELGILFFSLMLIGAGRFSLDAKVCGCCK